MTQPTQTVLILAYDFPPYNSVGGLRPYSWFKHMNEHGIYPIVVTRQWGTRHGNELDYIAPSAENQTVVENHSNGTILRTAYRPNLANRIQLRFGANRFVFVRRTVSAFYEFAQYVFPIGPKKELFRAAQRYLQKEQVDWILATGEPFVLFKYAHQLSKQFKTPWVADYRDPWTQSDRRSSSQIMKLWNTFFEKKYLKSCRQLVTVSGEFRELISELSFEKPIEVIPNGFDDLELDEAVTVEQDPTQLTIAFMGSIYPWYPIENVLSILFSFDNIHLKLIGISNGDEIKGLFTNRFHENENRVHWVPKVDILTLRKELRVCNAVLLFNDFGHIGSKIYTYLAVKRRILFCYSNSELSEQLRNEHYPYHVKDIAKNLQINLIQQTQSGVVVEDEKHLKKVLTDLSVEFQKNKKIVCEARGIDAYSRKKGVEKMANLLKQTK